MRSLPGFGSPAPADWTATPQEYARWLVRELQAVGKPVDVVGHDWGGVHVLTVPMTGPDLLRSWVSDVPGLLDPD